MLPVGLCLLALAGTPAQARRLPGAPYFFVYGLQRPAEVGAAVQALGCNVILLRLPEAEQDLDLKAARLVFSQASANGAQVVVALPTCLASRTTTRLSDALYRSTLAAYVRTVVPLFASEPALLGWATDDYLEKELDPTDADFAAFLTARYGSVADLNRRWGSRFTWVAGATMERALAPAMDGAPSAPAPVPGGAVAPTAAQGDPLEVPPQWGIAGLDLAEFRRQVFHDLMAFWAELIRGQDPDHLLFTGRVSLYRSLVSMPEAYDVVLPEVSPEVLEQDQLTHNVQAVDMARHQGQAVIPVLRLSPPPKDLTQPPELRPLDQWMVVAALHGASGAAFQDYGRLAGDPATPRELAKAIAHVRAQRDLYCGEPRGEVAILYEPFADGFEVLNTPIYGYLRQMSNGEPTQLCASFRRGTRYGGVDYLAVEDVTRRNLDRYAAIFAPICPRLPPEAETALVEYVRRGGALVADLGLGAAETGSWLQVPDRLLGLFGLQQLRRITATCGNFRTCATHPAFPSIGGGVESQGDFNALASRGTRVGGRSVDGAVAGWVATAVPTTREATWAIVDCEDLFAGDPSSPPPRVVPGLAPDPGRFAFSGIFVHPVGTGVGVFATFRLWAHWLPEHRMYQEFHQDLWERRLRYELLGEPFLPEALEMVAQEDDGLLLYNRGARRAVHVAAYAADHRAYRGAVALFSAAALASGGRRSGAALLTVGIPAASAVYLQPVPLRLRPVVGNCAAAIQRYDRECVSGLLGGNGAQPGARVEPEAIASGEGAIITPGGENAVRLTLHSGPYPVAPGSTHRLTLVGQDGQTRTEVLQATAEGALDAEVDVTLVRFDIRPAA